MPTHSQQDVEAQLKPYYSTFASIMLGAWSDWMTSPHVGGWTCNRSRAAFVWEQMIIRAHKAFSGDPNINIHRYRESYLFLSQGSVAFRLKKSDAKGLTSNFPTQAALEFHDPQAQLPGLPQVSRVDVVYVLNKIQTAIADVLIVARENKEILWTISALGGNENVITLGNIEPQSPKISTPKVKLVSVKSKLDKAENGGGE